MTTDEATLVRDALDFLEKVLIGVFSLTGAYLAHRFSREREREKALTEKVEELIKGIYRHQSWMFKRCSRSALSDPTFDEADPTHEVEVLFRVYFPSLKQERLHFLECTQQIRARLLDMLKLPNMPIIAADDEYIKTFLDHYLEACEIVFRAAANELPRN